MFGVGGPFKRVSVDHVFHGISHVWWEMAPTFNLPGPHQFQLQASYAGTDHRALDWVNVGEPGEDVSFLEHTDAYTREPYGKVLLTHYRVVITIPDGTVYVSGPVPIWGVLDEKHWKIAQEMVRQEQLRIGSLAGRQGFLLRKMRYGPLSAAATDEMTSLVVRPDNPDSFGTSRLVGFHPPQRLDVAIQQMEMTEASGDGPETHFTNTNSRLVNALASPPIYKDDVWVDADTDERWAVDAVKTSLHVRGTPLFVDVVLQRIPQDQITYEVPVDSMGTSEVPADQQPTSGCGSVAVNHDYPTDNHLVYQMADCCGIAGAEILVFAQADWDVGLRTAEYAVATSRTTTNGLWIWAVLLDPGDYTIVFELPGKFGPDITTLTVTEPPAAPPAALNPELPLPTIQSQFGQF